MQDLCLTRKDAEESDGTLPPENVRAMEVFAPKSQRATIVDLEGFHLRRHDDEQIWVVFDEEFPDGEMLFAVDPRRFPTSRHLRRYLQSVNKQGTETQCEGTGRTPGVY